MSIKIPFWDRFPEAFFFNLVHSPHTKSRIIVASLCSLSLPTKKIFRYGHFY